jgi:signal transduction histidine kinase
VTLTVKKGAGMWWFVVTDDGVGIERERLGTLLGKSGTGEEQGVGLLIKSEPDRGTKVTVQIPEEVL